MTTTEVQDPKARNEDSQKPGDRVERADRGDDRNREQGARNQARGQDQRARRPALNSDAVLSAVATCLQSDRNAGGRIIAATGRNAMVMLPRSAVGMTMIGAIGDVDRVMAFVERGSAKGFDPAKVAIKADYETRFFQHFAAIAAITAEAAVKFGVEDVRDPRVKEEINKLKKANAEAKSEAKNNAKA